MKWLMAGVEDLDRARKLLAYHVRTLTVTPEERLARRQNNGEKEATPLDATSLS